MDINIVIAEAVKNGLTEGMVDPAFVKAFTEVFQKNFNQQEQVIPPFNHNGAAKYLSITRQCLLRYVKLGVVKAGRLNGNNRYYKKDLDAAIIPIEVEPLQKHRS